MHHSRAPHRVPAWLCGAGLAALITAIALAATPRAWAHHPLGEEIEELTEKLEAKPNDLGLLLQRAELLSLAGETRLAEIDLRRIEKLHPGLPEPDLLRASAMLQGGRLIAAEQLLTSVIARVPHSADAYRLRATARVSLGRREDAAEDLAAAIEHARRQMPELYLERAQILADLGRVDEAAATLAAGVQRCGSAVTLENAAIDLDVRRGRFDEALVRLDAQRARTSRPAGILARQGDVLRAAGREPEAWVAYTSALEAIEALPEGSRSALAMRELETRVRTALAVNRDSEDGR